MKVLVTGADGQLGHEVVRCLQQTDCEIITPGLQEMDFMSPDAAGRVIAGYRPNWVINCAAYTQVDKAEDEPEAAFTINRDAAGKVAEAVAETGGQLLHVSTDFIFDGRQARPYLETDPANPLSVYGQSKLAGEQVVTRALPNALILRTAWIYGVNGHNFVKTMLRVATDGKPLRVVNDQTGSPTWAADLAAVMMRLLDSGADGVFHYTNAGSISWHEFACAILAEAAELGFAIKTCEVVPIPTAEYPTPATRPAYSVLDTGKIESLLALSVPAWRDSLKNMLKELQTCADC